MVVPDLKSTLLICLVTDLLHSVGSATIRKLAAQLPVDFHQIKHAIRSNQKQVDPAQGSSNLRQVLPDIASFTAYDSRGFAVGLMWVCRGSAILKPIANPHHTHHLLRHWPELSGTCIPMSIGTIAYRMVEVGKSLPVAHFGKLRNGQMISD